MSTFYAEATVTATGQLMADTGLTAEQVTYLRDAETRGLIRDLIVAEDIDLARAFNTIGE